MKSKLKVGSLFTNEKKIVTIIFFFQIKVFKRMNELRQQLSKMQKREKNAETITAYLHFFREITL